MGDGEVLEETRPEDCATHGRREVEIIAWKHSPGRMVYDNNELSAAVCVLSVFVVMR